MTEPEQQHQEVCLECLEAGVTTPLVRVMVNTRMPGALSDNSATYAPIPTWRCPKNRNHRRQDTSKF